MNKPLKLLLVVGVLAFAAAGLYYAMRAPARTGKVATNPPRQNQSRGVVFDEGNPRPPSEIPSAPPAATATVPASDRAMEKPADASSTGAVATSASAPTGFTPVNDPMKPLPSALPGFTAVQPDGAPAKPAVPAPSSTTAPAAASTTPAPSPTTVGTTAQTAAAPAPTTRPAPAPAPAAAAPEPAPLPPLPAASKPAASSMTSAKPAAATTYTVKEGDSIAGIWRSISGSERGWEKLLSANPGVDPSRLKIGQVLKVPDHTAPAVGEAREATTGATTTKSATAGTYTVQSGDTLSRIAAKTLGDSKRWKEIHDANRDTLGNDPSALEVGQTLKIPGKGGAAKPATTPATSPTPASTPAPR